MRHSIDSGLAVKGFLIPDPEIQGRLFLSLLISGASWVVGAREFQV